MEKGTKMPECNLLITYYFEDLYTPSRHWTSEHRFTKLGTLDSEYYLFSGMSRNIEFIFSSWFLYSWENFLYGIIEILSQLIKKSRLLKVNLICALSVTNLLVANESTCHHQRRLSIVSLSHKMWRHSHKAFNKTRDHIHFVIGINLEHVSYK